MKQRCKKLLHRNVLRFRCGLVFKAHRLVYHSTLGLRVIKKKKKLYIAATAYSQVPPPSVWFKARVGLITFSVIGAIRG